MLERPFVCRSDRKDIVFIERNPEHCRVRNTNGIRRRDIYEIWELTSEDECNHEEHDNWTEWFSIRDVIDEVLNRKVCSNCGKPQSDWSEWGEIE